MEEAQKKAQRSDLPITDWKPKADQTWRAWKETFNPLHKNLKRKTRLERG